MQSLKQIYPDIPVILASGMTVSVEAVREQEACVSAILSKPFDMQELLDAIGAATAIPKESVANST